MKKEQKSKELIEAYDTTMDLISATPPSSSLAALQLSLSHQNTIIKLASTSTESYLLPDSRKPVKLSESELGVGAHEDS